MSGGATVGLTDFPPDAPCSIQFIPGGTARFVDDTWIVARPNNVEAQQCGNPGKFLSRNDDDIDPVFTVLCDTHASISKKVLRDRNGHVITYFDLLTHQPAEPT